MREYKFRGYAIHGGWVYGNFIHSKRFHGCSNEFRIHDTFTGMESDVIPESVGHFTGLQDRNGIDIYEGDIIEFKYLKLYAEYLTGCLKFDEDNLCYAIYDKYNAEYPVGYNWGLLEVIEVIGNIFENPDILEAK
jgi:uncharacterized phage protein (TIGR01671 family)